MIGDIVCFYELQQYRKRLFLLPLLPINEWKLPDDPIIWSRLRVSLGALLLYDKNEFISLFCGGNPEQL